MKRLWIILALAGCAPALEMPAPIAYPGACPFGNTACQRNADAQTLAYIGQPNAAMTLMCVDENLSEALPEQCGILLSHY
jgi:hypothetical protein